MTNLSKNKVVLGLSGGVDSTTAALLLKEKGFQVTGYYFDALGNNDEGARAAAALADRLGIDFITEDVSDAFSHIVIKDFCRQYACGRTPNPCVICNPTVKFKSLIEVADRIGAYYIATGHYAQICHDEEQNVYYVKKGANERKDQSYMLYRLGQEVLSRIIFPLGSIDDKDKTRNLARSFGLPNADNADSQEICFIDESKESYQDYLARAGVEYKSGNFVDSAGKILGQHKGIPCYTIGQRKGLGIALGKPAFVTRINADKNEITLGDNEELFTRTVVSSDNVFADGIGPKKGEQIEVTAKIRYASKPAKAILTCLENGKIQTFFDDPQRAATPGQSIVFYKDDRVLGGGFID
ncbi:MAG: tRNA 2-thiouridine(34) synthase MnmA [Eubacteriaceae bacterium]|nr:tRNA 2-thiouridine(34) synthase MnmA [Eubacteriaceae bacterium]